MSPCFLGPRWWGFEAQRLNGEPDNASGVSLPALPTRWSWSPRLPLTALRPANVPCDSATARVVANTGAVNGAVNSAFRGSEWASDVVNSGYSNISCSLCAMRVAGRELVFLGSRLE
jgi:hypothetical protein